MVDPISRDGKKGGEWLLVSHDPLSQSTDWLRTVLGGLAVCRDCLQVTKLATVTFKFEPFILHVEADSLAHGQRLLGAALQAGYRNSGLVLASDQQRVMVQIRHTMKMDIPLGLRCQHGVCLLVDTKYIEWIVRKSNEMFETNVKRTLILQSEISEMFTRIDNSTKSESKEERRERKRREGLQLQQQSRFTIQTNQD
jgi:tRNA wybutosine-synthesizing protein 3